MHIVEPKKTSFSFTLSLSSTLHMDLYWLFLFLFQGRWEGFVILYFLFRLFCHPHPKKNLDALQPFVFSFFFCLGVGAGRRWPRGGVGMVRWGWVVVLSSYWNTIILENSLRSCGFQWDYRYQEWLEYREHVVDSLGLLIALMFQRQNSLCP